MDKQPGSTVTHTIHFQRKGSVFINTVSSGKEVQFSCSCFMFCFIFSQGNQTPYFVKIEIEPNQMKKQNKTQKSPKLTFSCFHNLMASLSLHPQCLLNVVTKAKIPQCCFRFRRKKHSVNIETDYQVSMMVKQYIFAGMLILQETWHVPLKFPNWPNVPGKKITYFWICFPAFCTLSTLPGFYPCVFLHACFILALNLQ